jgi:hypothetical protein
MLHRKDGTLMGLGDIVAGESGFEKDLSSLSSLSSIYQVSLISDLRRVTT